MVEPIVILVLTYLIKKDINMSLLNKIGLTLIAFFTPIIPALIVAGILITIDTITGIAAAKKNKEKIKSRTLSRVLGKMLAYYLLIIAAHLTEIYLFPELPFLRITLAYIGVVEFFSISENFSKITGKNFIKYVKDQVNGWVSKVKK